MKVNKKWLFVLICISFVIPSHIFALKMEADSFTIKPGETMSFDVILDTDEKIKSGSFKITTTSKYIGFDSINFVDEVTRNSSGSTYNFKVKEGTLEKDSKILTITLKASEDTKIGTKATIVISAIKLVTDKNKTLSLDTISQIVTCDEEQTKSNNANLKALTSTNFELPFEKNKTEYEVEVAYDVTKISLEAIPEDEKAKATIEGTNVTTGENTITVTVTAENGDKKEYKIKVKVKEEEKKPVSKTEKKPVKSYKGKWLIVVLLLGCLLVVNVFALKYKK